MAGAMRSNPVAFQSNSKEQSFQNPNILGTEESSDTATEETPAQSPTMELQPSELEEQLKGYEILHARRSNSDDLTSTDQHSPETGHQVMTVAPSHTSHTPSAAPTQSPNRSRWLLGGLLTCLHPVAAYLRKEQTPPIKKDSWEIPFTDIRELDFIGSGSQGAVFVGEYRGQKIAVKKVKDPSYCDGICQLRKLHHPNIVVFK